MNTLDLTDNTLLVCTAGGLFLQDPREAHVNNTADFLFRDDNGLASVFAVFRAARRNAAGEIVEAVTFQPDEPHEVYAGKVIEGHAAFADGAREFWRIRIDPLLMRFQWVRQPESADASLVFHIVTPRARRPLEIWQTGKGVETYTAAPHAAQPVPLDAPDEHEALFYSYTAKNALRMELPNSGHLRVMPRDGARACLGGAAWDVNDRGGPAALWDATWETGASAVVQLLVSCGLTPAVRHFDGRLRLYTANAALDFGAFYSAAVLGAMPLNLRRDALTARLYTRAAANTDARASIRDIAWTGELLYLVDPGAVAVLLRDTLDEYIESGKSVRDEDAALLLMIAGRHLDLTGDTAYAAARMEAFRGLGDHILALRADGDAIPTVRSTWEVQGSITAKEPYFTALAHAALQRLSALEFAAGTPDRGEACNAAALAMRRAAIEPVDDGGLWNHECGLFANYVDCSNPAAPVPHMEFALYQNIIPFWLGLVDDETVLFRAFEWIDGKYTYTTGRGGASLPPHSVRTFVVLLDVCVRHRSGVPGADTLLASVLAHALDHGLPMSSEPFGPAGMAFPAGTIGVAPAPVFGNLLDNAPYLALVLNLHYGLDYDHRGWRVGMQRPLRDYPITRITHLRHHHALYSITWRNAGRGRRVLLGGKPQRTNLLSATEGDHEVVIELHH